MDHEAEPGGRIGPTTELRWSRARSRLRFEGRRLPAIRTGRRALDAVSFEAHPPGRTVGDRRGRAVAGKTTLAQMIPEFLRP